MTSNAVELPVRHSNLASNRLAELEGVIEQGLATFANVGNALREIREQGLYTVEHDTFEAYCKARWGMEVRRAQQLMAGSKVVEDLNANNCSRLPTIESQARPLTTLKPGEQPVAWEMAVEKAGDGKVTAAIVEDAVVEVMDLRLDEDMRQRVRAFRDRPPLEIPPSTAKALKHLRAAVREIAAARKELPPTGSDTSTLRDVKRTIQKMIDRLKEVAT